MKFSEIATLTKRDQRTIWNTYNQAKNSQINVTEGEVIPVSIIADRRHGVLGSLILYLKEKGLSFQEIAATLDRNYQTIYTTYRKTIRRENEQ